jgi:hypothetical protein
METVIRSPMDGVIKKIAHWKGVSKVLISVKRLELTSLAGFVQGWYGAC